MSHISIKQHIKDIPADFRPDVLVTFVETSYHKTKGMTSGIAALAQAYAAAKQLKRPFFYVMIGREGACIVMLDDLAELKEALSILISGLTTGRAAVEIHNIVSPEVREELNALMRDAQLRSAGGGSA